MNDVSCHSRNSYISNVPTYNNIIDKHSRFHIKNHAHDIESTLPIEIQMYFHDDFLAIVYKMIYRMKINTSTFDQLFEHLEKIKALKLYYSDLFSSYNPNVDSVIIKNLLQFSSLNELITFHKLITNISMVYEIPNITLSSNVTLPYYIYSTYLQLMQRQISITRNDVVVYMPILRKLLILTKCILIYIPTSPFIINKKSISVWLQEEILIDFIIESLEDFFSKHKNTIPFIKIPILAKKIYMLHNDTSPNLFSKLIHCLYQL